MYPQQSLAGTFTVQWAVSQGATSYSLQRTDDGGLHWAEVHHGQSTEYEEKNLQDGAYTYRVQALTESAGSTYLTGSYPAVVEVIGTPPAPALLDYPDSAVAGVVEVSWSEVGGATSYSLERSNNAGPWEPVYGDAATSFNDMLGEGVYRYRVRAVVGTASGPWMTGEHDLVVQATAVGGPPLIDYPSESQSGSVVISWVAPEGADEFLLQRSSVGGGEPWTTILNGPESNHLDSVANGSYRYRVRVQSPQISEWTVGVGLVQVTAPSQPLIVTMIGSGSGQIDLSPGGQSCQSSCRSFHDFMSEIELSAQAHPGSVFAGWRGVCTGVGVCQVRMDQPRSVEAQFDIEAPTSFNQVFQNGFEQVVAPILPRIDVNQDSVLIFDGIGQIRTVAVTPLDASGVPIDLPDLVWSLSHPDMLQLSHLAPGIVSLEATQEVSERASLWVQHPESGAETVITVAPSNLLPQVIEIESADVISVSGNRRGAHTIVLRSTIVTQIIQPGDVILSGDAAGVMARATSVQPVGATLHVGVTPVTIEQVFDYLDVAGAGEPLLLVVRFENERLEVEVTSEDRVRVFYSEVFERGQAGFPMSCTSQVTGGTSVAFVPEFELVRALETSAQLSIVGGSVELFEVLVLGDVSLSAGGQLTASAGFEMAGSCEATLPRISLPPIQLKVFSLNPQIVPQFEIDFSASAGASVSVSAPTLHRQWSAVAGVRYQPPSGWDVVREYSSADLSQPAFLGVDAGLSFGITPKLGLGTVVDFRVGLGSFGYLLASSEIFTLTGSLPAQFNLPLHPPPSSPGYAGPNSSIRAVVDGWVGLKGEALAALSSITPLDLSFNVGWPLLSESVFLYQSPVPVGSLQCVPNCSQLLAGSQNNVSVLTQAVTSAQGAVDVYLRRDGADSLTLWGTTTFVNGAASFSRAVAELEPGTYTVHVRLRLGGVLYAYSQPFPFASATAVGQFIVQSPDPVTNIGTIGVEVRDALNQPAGSAQVSGSSMSPGNPNLSFPSTGANGQAVLESVPVGQYRFVVRRHGANPFDSLPEVWAERVVDVGAGQNPLQVLARSFPYVEELWVERQSDGSLVSPGATVVPGTPLRIHARVRNRLNVAQNAQLQFYIDRTGVAGVDHHLVSPSLSVAAGSTRVFTANFTPSATGTFSSAVRTLVAGWGKTDAWNWSPGFVVEAQVGSIQVTVRDHNNVPSAGVKVVAAGLGGLADLPIQTTNGSGIVTFTNAPVGQYQFQAYFEGPNPFDSLGELWAEETRNVSTGSNPAMELARNYPYVEDLWIERQSNGSVLSPGASVAPGTPLRIHARVRNRLDVEQTVQLQFYVDRTGTAGIDHNLMSSSLLVAADSTRVFTVNFTPTQTGSFSRAVKTTVSGWGKTDAWNWSTAFVIEPQVGSIQVTVRDQNNVLRSGVKVVGAGLGGLADLPTLTTNSNGSVTFTNAPLGQYRFQAYFEGPNPFDSLGELWAESARTLSAGSNSSLTLVRNYPHVEDLWIERQSNGSVVSPGTSVAPGTPLRIVGRVRNRLDVPQTTQLQYYVDRTGVSGIDHNLTSSALSVAANSSRLFTVNFTPSATGTFSMAVKTTVSGWGKTDAWNWGPAFVAEPQLGSIQVTVRDHNNVLRSGVRVVAAGLGGLADLPTRTTNSSGSVTFTNAPVGQYQFQAYFEGPNPFDSLGELWAEQTRTLVAGSNSTLSLTRNYPYVEDLWIERQSNGSVVSPGASVAQGTPLRIVGRVRNGLNVNRTVQLQFYVDRTGVSGIDHNLFSSSLSVNANSTRLFTANFTPSASGTFSKAVKATVSGWGKTDAWNWGPGFVIQVPDGASLSNLSVPSGTHYPGRPADTSVRVTNTGGSSRTFWVGASYQRPNGQWIDLPVATRTLNSGGSSTVSFIYDFPWSCPTPSSAWIGSYSVVVAVWDRHPSQTNAVRFAELVRNNAFSFQNGFVNITWPGNNATVPHQITVQGSSAGVRQLSLQVCTDQCYPQGSVNVGSSGSWSGPVTVGAAGSSGISATIRATSTDCSSYTSQRTVFR